MGNRITSNEKSMKAFLLTAGLGTRLRPLTDKMPKCLLPINGKPLLQIWLELLSRNGVDQVLINTHWHHEKVEVFVKQRVNNYSLLVNGGKDRDQMSEVRSQRSGKDRREEGGKVRRKDEHRTSTCRDSARARRDVQHRPSEIEKKFHGVKMMNGKTEIRRQRSEVGGQRTGVGGKDKAKQFHQSSIVNHQSSIQKGEEGEKWPDVRLSYEPELLGSGGTLLANRDWVDDGEPFFILYGDNLTNFDLEQMYDFHCRSPLPFSLGVFKTHEPERCGIAEIDENGVVIDFVEKPENPKSNLAHAGINVADNRIFDFYPPNAESIRPLDLGFHVIPNLVGKMKAYFIEEFLMDIGTPESYEKAQAIWSR